MKKLIKVSIPFPLDDMPTYILCEFYRIHDKINVGYEFFLPKGAGKKYDNLFYHVNCIKGKKVYYVSFHRVTGVRPLY
jgi:hypothetical protein